MSRYYRHFGCGPARVTPLWKQMPENHCTQYFISVKTMFFNLMIYSVGVIPRFYRLTENWQRACYKGCKLFPACRSTELTGRFKDVLIPCVNCCQVTWLKTLYTRSRRNQEQYWCYNRILWCMQWSHFKILLLLLLILISRKRIFSPVSQQKHHKCIYCLACLAVLSPIRVFETTNSSVMLSRHKMTFEWPVFFKCKVCYC